MALSIPSLANPYDPESPIANAYAWMTSLTLDLRGQTGRIVLAINPSDKAWDALPLREVEVTLGQVLAPATAGPQGTPAVRFPTLAELLADPAVFAAFQSLGAKLYAVIATHHPDFAGAQPC